MGVFHEWPKCLAITSDAFLWHHVSSPHAENPACRASFDSFMRSRIIFAPACYSSRLGHSPHAHHPHSGVIQIIFQSGARGCAFLHFTFPVFLDCSWQHVGSLRACWHVPTEYWVLPHHFIVKIGKQEGDHKQELCANSAMVFPGRSQLDSPACTCEPPILQ